MANSSNNQNSQNNTTTMVPRNNTVPQTTLPPLNPLPPLHAQNNGNNKKGKIIVGSLAALLGVILLGAALSRDDSKTGTVKPVPDETKKPPVTGFELGDTSSEERSSGALEELSMGYTITHAQFESIVGSFTSTIKSSLGNTLDTKDILKFVSLANINEIKEGNPELSDELYGIESREEYIGDVGKVIGAIVTYDFNVWNQTNSTDQFIRVSDAIIGSQKDKMIKIENYVNKIAAAVNANDETLVNSITAEFILDMNSGELSKLDDGVGFVSQVYIAVIADGVARNYLNQENFDMLQLLKEANKYTSNIFVKYDKCKTKSH